MSYSNAAGDTYNVYVSGNRASFADSMDECKIDNLDHVDLQTEEEMNVSYLGYQIDSKQFSVI